MSDSPGLQAEGLKPVTSVAVEHQQLFQSQFSHFNPVQTACFNDIYESNKNVVVAGSFCYFLGALYTIFIVTWVSSSDWLWENRFAYPFEVKAKTPATCNRICHHDQFFLSWPSLVSSKRAEQLRKQCILLLWSKYPCLDNLSLQLENWTWDV